MRTYRHKHDKNRFVNFTAVYKDTDLWVGINNAGSNIADVKRFVIQRIIYYRQILEQYIAKNPMFGESHKPVQVLQDMPNITKRMAIAANYANTGPMAGVAGAFAQFITKDIVKKYNPKEIVIENGGDIYIVAKQDIIVSIYAGNSPLSDKIGIRIPASQTPIGICTSAGTFGNSFSYGKADAAVVAMYDCIKADTMATAIANQIKTVDDLSKTINKYKNKTEIKSICLIKDDKIAIAGDLEIVVLATK